MRRKILMVVANPTTATTTGWPVGFWASELIHPCHVFTEAGHEVAIASPRGGRVEVDALSDPRDASGYSADDDLSRRYLDDDSFTARLADTVPVAGLSADDFDAIVVVGGQAPMFTFVSETELHRRFFEFVARDKVTAALCHGTCLLLYLRKHGQPLIEGRRMTGFTNDEEDAADAAVGQRLMPFRIEDEARALGAEFVAAPAFEAHVVRDGRLITGQQQNSGEATARCVLEALEEETA